MASDADTAPLAELAAIAVGKTPPTADPTFFEGHVPFVTPVDMDGRRTIERTVRTLSDAGARAIAGARAPRGALLVTCIGTGLGKVAIAGVDAVHNQQICRVEVRPPHDPLYVYYQLRLRSAALRRAAGGSAQPIINKAALGRLPMTVPPPAEQRSIGAILGAFDDRIAVADQSTATLADLARALFEETLGRDPDAPLPPGWERSTIGRLAVLDKGLSYRSGGLDERGAPLIGLGNFQPGGGFTAERLKRYSGTWSPRHVIAPGELLLAAVDLTQRRELLGAPLLAPDLGEAPVLFSHHAYAVRPTAPGEGWREFLYFTLLADRFRARAAGFAAGTAVLALPRDAILEHAVAVPPEPERVGFARIVAPILLRIDHARRHADALARMRDELLPRLMSGEYTLDQLRAAETAP
jgi:type I restriction enzyme S subunit